ncbi:TPA: YdcF family protein [Candidatus Berkelbacteria bacterium]|uniref:Membrane protein n=1 Tax=Berkelbacteria bacterium GW2011_GWE1_39_12 TaxID=1618337 RepID=A0A0G4B3M0_9BACT|nr:MAG: Membrane protein [Berkelbacteria bacterium GW2011_GWE1_39_12]HBO61036.1 YdcF family protein [Candidatus Berkelbacteria bacterium]
MPESLNFEGISQPEFNEREEKKPIDALVVFGGGIVSDNSYRARESGKSLIGHPEGGWRLPLSAKLRVLATADLFSKGMVGDVILTGGAVKEKEGFLTSEAALMKKYLRQKLIHKWQREALEIARSHGEVSDEKEGQARQSAEEKWLESEPHIILEDKATNTIENFAYTVNYLEKNKAKYQNISLLSNNFHIDRITKLAKKFAVDGKGIGAETIMSQIDPRYDQLIQNYLNPEKNDEYRQEIIDSVPDEEKQKYLARLGGSAKDAMKSEKRFSRGLDEIPEYWLPNVKHIENFDYLKQILAAEEKTQEVLEEKGIPNVNEASEEEVRNVLDNLERIIPPEEWGE